MHTALIPEVDYDPYDEEELKIQQWRVDTAMAPGDRRIDRYRRLLAEWHPRAADRAETGTRAPRFARG